MLTRATDFFRRRLPARWVPASVAAPVTPVTGKSSWLRYVVYAALWAHFCMSIVVYWDKDKISGPVKACVTVNAFKLYARFELLHLVTEFVGSNDGGRTWHPYEFRYFPQQLDRISPFLAPRFPRFEATLQILLATRNEPSSLYGIVAGHLLALNPEVLRLFRNNPFPDGPPQMIRMPTYHYNLTDYATYRATRHFWQRNYVGDYLRMIYVNEQGAITRAESEIEETRVLAGYGNPAAQNRLGLLYVNGEQGLDRDMASAGVWFRRAAEQDLAEAQFNLALILESGDGVRKDLAQAFYWCRRAADQGFTNAQDMLGIMYFQGSGSPKNPVEALAWFQVAAHYGHEGAREHLALAKPMLGPESILAAERRFQDICVEIEARK